MHHTGWLQQEVKKKKKTLSYEYFKLDEWFIQQPFADSNTLTNQRKENLRSSSTNSQIESSNLRNHHCSNLDSHQSTKEKSATSHNNLPLNVYESIKGLFLLVQIVRNRIPLPSHLLEYHQLPSSWKIKCDRFFVNGEIDR